MSSPPGVANSLTLDYLNGPSHKLVRNSVTFQGWGLLQFLFNKLTRFLKLKASELYLNTQERQRKNTIKQQSFVNDVSLNPAGRQASEWGIVPLTRPPVLCPQINSLPLKVIKLWVNSVPAFHLLTAFKSCWVPKYHLTTSLSDSSLPGTYCLMGFNDVP